MRRSRIEWMMADVCKTAGKGACAAALLTVTLLAGCHSTGAVRSKVVVTSDPPGADVTMNDVHLGRTPVEMPFTWYWYYDFTAELEGHETAFQRHRFRAPPYLWPGVDLLMETMPFPVRDTREIHFDMRALEDRPRPEFASH